MLPFAWICCWFTLLAPALARAVLPTHDEPTRTLYLVRHGEYDHESEGCDPGDECGLVALGRQQARLLAERLDAMPIAFTSLQTSTMTRARETAAIIAERFPDLVLERQDDLRECTPTTRRPDIMAGLEPGEAAACDSALAGAWQRLALPADGPGDAHDIVVCHGNVIRWFVCRALGVDPTAWLGMSIANCSLTVMQIRADGSAKLIAFADAGHLPYAMTTYPGVSAPQ
jgi:serine/threonine-protein phosphatase PGAM5